MKKHRLECLLGSHVWIVHESPCFRHCRFCYKCQYETLSPKVWIDQDYRIGR